MRRLNLAVGTLNWYICSENQELKSIILKIRPQKNPESGFEIKSSQTTLEKILCVQ